MKNQLSFLLSICLLVFMSSCEQQPIPDIHTDGQYTMEKIHQLVSSEVTDYQILSINADAYYQQVKDNFGSGDITLNFDFPAEVPGTYQLNYDVETIDDPQSNKDFFYLNNYSARSTNNSSFFSFWKDLTMYGTVTLKSHQAEDEAYVNTTYSVESIYSFLNIPDEDELLEDMYVFYNTANMIADEKQGGCGTLTEPSDTGSPSEENTNVSLKSPTSKYYGTYDVHLYSGYYYIKWFSGNSQQESYKAKSKTYDIALTARHIYIGEQSVDIDFRFSHEFGWFSWNAPRSSQGILKRLQAFRQSISGPNGKEIFYLVEDRSGLSNPNILGSTFQGGGCQHPNLKPYACSARAHGLNRRHNGLVIAHEWGHSLGLGHHVNDKHLMAAYLLNGSRGWIGGSEKNKIRNHWVNNCN